MMISGKEKIDRFRLCALKGALRLEKAGLKKRGQSAQTMAKIELGLKPKSRISIDKLIEGIEGLLKENE
jgi:hypothetical protein